MSLLQNSNAIETGGYNIANSLRFQSASSQYLARTPASNGNRQKFTFSFWAKRGTLSAAQEMYFVNSGGGNFSQISWTSGNAITITSVDSSVASCELVTTPVYRDPSAWYHLVISVDTTQATASNRVKIYVNGSQVTALSTATYPSLNYNFQLNNTTAQNIGRPSTGTFDGYLAEYNFIDGQQYDPSYFGETNTLTGQWVAKKYTGTYGTNGFYLPFSNGTSTTTLGADSSGNSNNWTLNNFTRSAGVSDCWMNDVPSGNGSAVGSTQPNSNYSTLNPLKVSGATLALANLRATTSEGQFYTNTMNIPSTGKWYWEFTLTSITGGSNQGVLNGVAPSNSVFSGFPNASSFAVTATLALSSNWVIYQNGSVIYSSSKPFVAGDVVQYALDRDNQRFWLGVNGTWYATGTPNPATNTSPTISYTTTGDLEIMCQGGGGGAGSSVVNWNFGQRSFAYTPPSGFKALCTANLPASTIVKGNQYMDATTYTGSASAQTITNAGGFSPDLVWVKSRSDATGHILEDTVRGALQYLGSESTAAESTLAGSITSFNSNGFSVGTQAGTNFAGRTFVAWQWDAGSSTVTNTSGTISSQVRANPTAGVSVVTYTGTGANATVGHGLGVAPKMVITKNRSASSGWLTYHVSTGAGAYLSLASTAASSPDTSIWQNTSPTSSVFSIGTAVSQNTNNYVAYCFAEIAGFSKFGSYTGNGSTDGVFVYTGFKPKYVMTKAYSSAGYNWNTYDSARSPSNANSNVLFPSTSGAEETGFDPIDLLSNGFKLRMGNRGSNVSGVSYIFMAFAENPFAQSNAV